MIRYITLTNQATTPVNSEIFENKIAFKMQGGGQQHRKICENFSKCNFLFIILIIPSFSFFVFLSQPKIQLFPLLFLFIPKNKVFFNIINNLFSDFYDHITSILWKKENIFIFLITFI